MRFYKQTCLHQHFYHSTTFSYADIKVVASIKPIHSLVSAISEGIGEPTLLVKGAGSSYVFTETFASKRIAGSRCYFLDGQRLEAFLENSINNIAANAMTISLMESDKLTKLNFREGGSFDDHGHDDHGHDKHDDHGHDKHDDHGHDKHDDHGHDKHDDHEHDKHDDHGHDKHDDHGHDKHDDHAHHDVDPHVWLDPLNAIVLVEEIKNALISADPKNESAYEENAR